ncbi:MAG: TAT-variant-translocated molybdopterin oxidoreductase [Acidobacteria bacterium]|nr:TAT-variant-translocated molybdopterin oxidoreductase [Acidobacteriota bacterium]
MNDPLHILNNAGPAESTAARRERFWRTLEEAMDDPAVRARLGRELPRDEGYLDPVSRRRFLQLSAVTLAVAGVTACTKQPLEPIVPYVRQPEGMTLGNPLFFATAFPLSGILRPVLVRSNEGRPTKIEGNPQHPASLGGTSVFSQGSLYDLYDPDRSQTIEYLGDVRTWAGFLGAMRGQVNAQKALGGAGIRLLTGTTTSPSFAAQVNALRKTFPQMKWHVYEPINRDMAKLGAKQAFGQVVDTRYDLAAADVVVSLDANFLSGEFPGFERYARDFAGRRKPDAGREMLRFYAIETSPTNTGGKADHRLGLKPSDFQQAVRTLGSLVQATGATAGDIPGPFGSFVLAVSAELGRARGRSLIIAGDHAPAEVHALAHQMNAALGNVGKTVFYTDPVEANPAVHIDSLKELVSDLQGNKVDLLIISGVNPVFDAPADLEFAKWIGAARLVVHHGLYQDETSAHAHWHVNAAHYLESWSDGRAYDGSISIIQPLIAPLYGGKTEHELLAGFSDNPDAAAYELIRGFWQSQQGGATGTRSAPGAMPGENAGGTLPPATPDFEIWWRRAVHDGYVGNSMLPEKSLAVRAGAIPVAAESAPNQLQVVFRPDPTVYDGRFGNNAWLQEIEKPLTTITWDNTIWTSLALAQRLGLYEAAMQQKQNVVELELGGRKVRGALYVQPGMPDGMITVFTGYGHTHIGHTGNGFGYNACAIRSSDAPWSAAGARIAQTGETLPIAKIQPEQQVHAGDIGKTTRDLVRIGTLEKYRQNPHFAQAAETQEPGTHGPDELPKDSLYPGWNYSSGYQWAMVIDLNSCVGCNACIVACQAENNIAVVGKEQVLKRRPMHWLRVDTYYDDLDNPRMYFQPLPCMQCESAPCEYVCPVGATTHSTEGLNDMTYNRCVGTRYCSNNCPYKVRRFNFFLFQDWNTPQLKLMRNPEVSVRSRGVMEKCTYCVQRITKARIAAEEEDRPIRDQEFTTACAQACPADAIVFGDQNQKDGRTARLKASPRNYGLLEELNTRPRTTYLAGVLNPNAALHTRDVQEAEEE